MKWGQRNGPPYPLRAGDHSAAEVKANPKLAVGNSGSVQKQQAKSQKIKYARNPRKYSDNELKERVNRMKLEEEYRRLNGQLTKEQINQIKSLGARNIWGVATDTLPRGAVEAGKEFIKVASTINMKIHLAWVQTLAPEIARAWGSTMKLGNANGKGNGKGKGKNKDDDDDGFTPPTEEEKWLL